MCSISDPAAAQDWRRQRYPQQSQQYRPQRTYPQYQTQRPVQRPGRPSRTDPTASSDRPPHTDPSAQSDQFTPPTPSWPQQTLYPPYYPPQVIYPPQVQYPPQFLPQPKRLGVNYQSTHRGAYITYVQPGSPAFRVGIEPGDVILDVDGIPVGGGGSDLGHTLRVSDGFVSIHIIDVRSGTVVRRNVDLTQ